MKTTLGFVPACCRQALACLLGPGFVLSCFFLLGGAAGAQAQLNAPPDALSSGIPPQLGWHKIPNTQLAPHCPEEPAIQGNTGCRAVISAWNGGIADTKRNRLIFWGGGHTDYYGNEVYALDLEQLKIVRLTEPSPATGVDSCPEAYRDGRPVARHTYNGLAYVEDTDRMFVFGGSKSSCGFMSAATWMLDFGKLTWQTMVPRHGAKPVNAPGAAADYDPNTKLVFLADAEEFFSYDQNKNEYTRLGSLPGAESHLSGIVDPIHQLFLLMDGTGRLWSVEIGRKKKYAVHDWTHKTRGCEGLLRSPYPGLAFDQEQELVVGWTGGDSVFLLDPVHLSCTERKFPGGPGPAQENGTNGRFRYFPRLHVFALVNDWKQDAYTLRLTPLP